MLPFDSPVLLVLPEVPWPATTGGKRAHLITLDRLRGMGLEVHVVAADIDSPASTVKDITDGKYGPHITVVHTQSPKKQTSKFKKAIAFLNGLLSPYPSQYVHLVRSSGLASVQKLLRAHSYGCIWVDHLFALALVPDEPLCRVVVSTQNIETDLMLAAVVQAKQWSRRLKRFADYLRLLPLEPRLLRRADRLVCLSPADADVIRTRFGISASAVVLPIAEAMAARWQPLERPSLIFVGSYDFAPNQDAIDWIVVNLSPTLLDACPEVVIRIVGGGRYPYHSHDFANVEFCGQLDDGKLASVLAGSTAMICPVIIGSGIKMKVVAAASCGVPVIATTESLSGLDFISAALVIDRESATVATEICRVLKETDVLRRNSEKNLSSIASQQAALSIIFDSLLKK